MESIVVDYVIVYVFAFHCQYDCHIIVTEPIHNPSSIFMCCVIYDLEGSNDANPQDANLTLVGEICFP
jgi:hypothetical protein